MKLITRNTDYAVKALCFLARSRMQRVSVSELVRHLRIPRPFLRKILQRLQKMGVLRSYRGIGGGFQLAIPADKIALVDVMGFFQGPVESNDCLFRWGACPDTHSCTLRSKINSIKRYVSMQLRTISIGSLIGQPGKSSREEAA